MLKYFILFFVFGYSPCIPWHYEEYLQKWTLGSAVNVTVGPPNVPYCKVTDNNHNVVFDGLGPCRIVLDKVTMEHEGRWILWYAYSGEVEADRSSLDVQVRDIKPVVTSDVVKNDTSVTVTCSVPFENQVQACVFTNPQDQGFIASRVNQYTRHNDRYESYAGYNKCTLRLLMPSIEKPGIWRCAVYTNASQDPSYDFISIWAATLGSTDYHYDPVPRLEPGWPNTGNEGELNKMTCSVQAAIRYCYFRSPNGTILNVSPFTSSPGYEYVGSGFDAGECGIKFDSPWIMQSGYYDSWTCNVGLVNRFEEQKAYFIVMKSLTTNYFWNGDSVVMSLDVPEQRFNQVEYCRFVRSDGLGFTNSQSPSQYWTQKYDQYGTCSLTILDPAAENDVRTWTIVAKLKDKEEMSKTVTWEFESNTTAIILWSVFGTLSVFLVVPLLSKKHRQWTYQKASSMKNRIKTISFRRQKHTEPLNVVTDPARAGYTTI